MNLDPSTISTQPLDHLGLIAAVVHDLGFINTRFYMFSKFFENKPLSRLLGEGILAEHLNDDAIEWVDLDNGYKISHLKSNYGKIEQRWLLVFSQKGYKREIKTLERQISKEKSEIENKLWHLSNQSFQCPEDAKKSLQAFKKLKFHQVEGKVDAILKQASRGRPKPGIKPQVVGYKGQSQVEQGLFTG